MKHTIPFSFFFLFFFYVTKFPQYPTLKSSSLYYSSDILINQTCKQCADRSPTVLSSAFCAASLRSVPVSIAVTNLHGLALLAVDLALANATATIIALEQTLASPTTDPISLACLRDCLELYSDGAATLGDAAWALLRGRYKEAGVRLSAAMEAPETCREGFREMGREVVPPQLGRGNYDLFRLCDIALCIAHLLLHDHHHYCVEY